MEHSIIDCARSASELHQAKQIIIDCKSQMDGMPIMRDSN